jgi:hypothetical protein
VPSTADTLDGQALRPHERAESADHWRTDNASIGTHAQYTDELESSSLWFLACENSRPFRVTVQRILHSTPLAWSVAFHPRHRER